MTTVPTPADDALIRQAAFHHVRRLQALHGQLSAAQIGAGFMLGGERLPLVNPQRGIFKPRPMRSCLSIRTVFPRSGARIWYDDQREAQRKVFAAHETVDYAFMGKDPEAAENRWLREAFREQVPLIYFFGFAPGLYHAIIPAFIADWDATRLVARIAFGLPDEAGLSLPATAPERRYALDIVKRRLHQNTFREAVLMAYEGRCALSGLPEARLLDAAHIMADGHAGYGQPVVPNGIPLTKIHHAAFDAHLIGIDPDYRLHVSEKLLIQRDGPMLEALKRLDGGTIHLPARDRDRPDRERLARRFEDFQAAQ